MTRNPQPLSSRNPSTLNLSARGDAQPSTSQLAWFVHDSGAGAQYVPVIVRSVGPRGMWATVERADGGRARVRAGDLQPAHAEDWHDAWK